MDKKKEIIDVKMIFFFNIGFFGAPGSFPPIILSSFFTPIGRTVNNTSHQITTNMTIISRPNKPTPVQVLLMYHRNLLDVRKLLVFCEHLSWVFHHLKFVPHFF